MSAKLANLPDVGQLAYPTYQSLYRIDQAAVLSLFQKHVFIGSGIQISVDSLDLVFKQVNPRIIGKRISPDYLDAMETQLNNRIKCGIATALAALSLK